MQLLLIYIHTDIELNLNRAIGHSLPPIAAVNFIQSDNKWSLLLLEKVERLDRLRFQPVHEVNYQYSDITKRRSSGPNAIESENRNVLKAIAFERSLTVD
jgi:hypothetical protein